MALEEFENQSNREYLHKVYIRSNMRSIWGLYNLCIEVWEQPPDLVQNQLQNGVVFGGPAWVGPFGEPKTCQNQSWN